MGEAADSFFVLGCIDLDVAFALPLAFIREHLQELHTTTLKSGPTYWHIKVIEPSPDTYALQMPKTGNHIPLEQYTFPVNAPT